MGTKLNLTVHVTAVYEVGVKVDDTENKEDIVKKAEREITRKHSQGLPPDRVFWQVFDENGEDIK